MSADTQGDRMSNIEHWSNDALDRVQRELAGAETPLYLMADDILRVLEEAEAVPSTTTQGAVSLLDDLSDVLADVQAGVVPADGSIVRDVLKRAVNHVNGGQ